MNATRRTYARVCTHGPVWNRGRTQIPGSIAFLAACFGIVAACSNDEATPQVPLNPPNRRGTATNNDDTSEAAVGGSDDGSGSQSQGGSDDGSGNQSQGGSDDGEDTGSTDAGGAGGDSSAASGGKGGSTSGTSESTSATGSSCKAGVDTGDPCDPEIDTTVCVRSTRDCTCGDDSTWSCTPKSGMGTGGSSS